MFWNYNTTFFLHCFYGLRTSNVRLNNWSIKILTKNIFSIVYTYIRHVFQLPLTCETDPLKINSQLSTQTKIKIILLQKVCHSTR